MLELGDRIEVSLHLKLPGELPLERAHALASAVEEAILADAPDVDAVQTHLEPLAEPVAAAAVAAAAEEGSIRAIVAEATGSEPVELRFLRSDEGLVVFLTLALDPSRTLAEAHARASAVEERIRIAHPGIGDVIVHTEP